MDVLIDIKNRFGTTEIQIDGDNKKMWINGKNVATDVDVFLSRLFWYNCIMGKRVLSWYVGCWRVLSLYNRWKTNSKSTL